MYNVPLEITSSKVVAVIAASKATAGTISPLSMVFFCCSSIVFALVGLITVGYFLSDHHDLGNGGRFFCLLFSSAITVMFFYMAYLSYLELQFMIGGG